MGYLGGEDLTYSVGLGVGVFVSAGLGAEPAGLGASGSTSNRGFPTPRLSPAATWNLVMTPAVGLLI